jgi:hypothetical protein
MGEMQPAAWRSIVPALVVMLFCAATRISRSGRCQPTIRAWVMAPAGNRAHGATRDVPLRRFHAYDRMMKILLNLDFS